MTVLFPDCWPLELCIGGAEGIVVAGTVGLAFGGSVSGAEVE